MHVRIEYALVVTNTNKSLLGLHLFSPFSFFLFYYYCVFNKQQKKKKSVCCAKLKDVHVVYAALKKQTYMAIAA